MRLEAPVIARAMPVCARDASSEVAESEARA
jgi:hypothetical protein